VEDLAVEWAQVLECLVEEDQWAQEELQEWSFQQPVELVSLEEEVHWALEGTLD